MDIQKVKKMGGVIVLATVLVVSILIFLLQPDDEFSDIDLQPIQPEITYAPAPIKASLDADRKDQTEATISTNTLTVTPENENEIPEIAIAVEQILLNNEKAHVIDEHATEDDVPVSINEISATNLPSYYDLTRSLSKKIELQKLLNEQSDLLAHAKAKLIETERLELALAVAKKQADVIFNPPVLVPVPKKQTVKKPKTAKPDTKKKIAPLKKHLAVKLLALSPKNATAVVIINASEHTVHDGYKFEDIAILSIQWRSNTITYKEHGKTFTIKLNSDRVAKSIEKVDHNTIELNSDRVEKSTEKGDHNHD